MPHHWRRSSRPPQQRSSTRRRCPGAALLLRVAAAATRDSRRTELTVCSPASPRTAASRRCRVASPHADAASPLLHAPQMPRRFPPAPPMVPFSDADIATGGQPGQLRLASYRRPTRTVPPSAATAGRPPTCFGRRRLPSARPPGRSFGT
jgi:hypothetical protein